MAKYGASAEGPEAVLKLVKTLAPVALIALAVDRCMPLSALWRIPGGAEACNIKGNISITTGERIYHVTGGEWYDETRIDRARGERWFCSEEEAREAGWRKSYE